MRSYRQAQQELYALLQERSPGLSLRRSRDFQSLWVAFGRGEWPELPGIRAQRQSNGLWLLDFTREQWQKETVGLPQVAPPFFPEQEEAYALCRLLLAHPAPLEEQPMEPLRQVYRFVSGEATLAGLREEAALCLRKGLPLASLAGGMLARWLEENKTNGQEEKR